MKRRLDLALALVHRPRVLFLDEPTTGLDPQSRTALWEKVARLVKQEATTVFLTTQYLEEADILADRVGIIDSGEIVAEDTPERLKAEIGRPTLEVVPVDGGQWTAVSEVLQQFGELVNATNRGIAVRSPRHGGSRQRDPSARRPGSAGRQRPAPRTHPGRRLPGQDRPLAGRCRGGGRGGRARRARPVQRRPSGARGAQRRSLPVTPSLGAQIGSRRSISRTLRQPVIFIPSFLFPLFLLAVFAGASDRVTSIKGFPTDSYITFILGAMVVQPPRAPRRWPGSSSAGTSSRASSTA